MFRESRSYIIALLFLAFMLRAMVPVGFMPDFAGHGVRLTICTGDGTQHLQLPAQYNPFAAKDIPAAHHNVPCDFHLTSVGMMPVFDTLPPLSVPVAMTVLVFLLAAASIYQRRRYLWAVAQAPPGFPCN